MKVLAYAAGVALATALAAAAAAGQEADGRMLYLKNCRQCHGATGVPSPQSRHKYPKIQTLADPAFMSKVSDDSLVAVMKHGGKEMRSFSEKLSPAEMAAVAKYVRTLASAAPKPE